MTLAQGTRLGPYQIVAPIGAGGMSEVDKARDTRRERTVALKVLPSHLSGTVPVLGSHSVPLHLIVNWTARLKSQ